VLPNDLQKDVTVVDFELPNFEEIKNVLEEMISANRQHGRIVVALNDVEIERLVKAALGLFPRCAWTEPFGMLAP
jgi:hypothetical protein